MWKLQKKKERKKERISVKEEEITLYSECNSYKYRFHLLSGEFEATC